MRTLSASLVVTLSLAAPAFAQDAPPAGSPQQPPPSYPPNYPPNYTVTPGYDAQQAPPGYPAYQPAPGYQQPPPGYQQQPPPGYQQQPPPGYQQPPPGYGPGQSPPSYEQQQPPAYGEQQPPPGYGEGQQPPADDGVGYDDAGLEALEQQSVVDASGYVDDGYDAEAYVDFQGSLAPYGQWMNDPTYGQVWAPSASIVGAGFSPYASGGHWALTEYGWTWVSNYDWGWAPFHYGRWSVFGNNGWCWIPGRVWGPAWVGWRWGRGYAGWAPLAPRRMSVAPPPPAGSRSYWRFTTSAGLAAARPAFVQGNSVHGAFAMTSPMRNVQVLNNYHVEAGPPPHMVAAAMGRPITPASVHGFAQAAPRATIMPRSAPVALSTGFSHNPAARPFAPGTSSYRAQAQVASNYRAAQRQAYGGGSAPGYHYGSGSQSPGAYHYNAAAAPSYHYNAPSTPSYHYSSPAPSYHQSAPSYSAPSRSSGSSSFSRPSFSGGGGFRGGRR